MPVHRHLHGKLGTVYAFRDEVDRWWQGRRHDLGAVGGNGTSERRSPLGGERFAGTLAAAILVMAVGATVTLIVIPRRTAGDQAQFRFSIVPPDRGGFGTSAVSPDGRYLTFTVANEDGASQLWLRRLDSVEAHTLPGTDGATLPFWAPDSRTIGFFAEGKLKTIPLSGGSARTVAVAPVGRGGTWSRDDVILFAPAREGPLHRVPASGGVASPVTTVDAARHRAHLWPEFLPDGRHFVYLADSVEAEHHGLYVGALDGRGGKHLVRAQSNAVYAQTGALLFVRDGTLVSQQFDVASLQLTGGHTIVADRLTQPYGLDHKGDFSVSTTGVLAFRSGGSPLKQLVWLDRRGERRGRLSELADYAEPVLSPDGTRVAVSIFDPPPQRSSDIWLVDVASGARSRLTFDPAADFEPVWSPDGADVIFTSNRSGTMDLYRKRASGAGADELLLASDTNKHSESWSPDGHALTYSSVERKTRFDVWLLPLGGDRRPVPLFHGEFSEGQTQISPDGRWIAYTSYESGRMEVYVSAFPGGDGKWQISSSGGADPRWRRDGRELFYIAANGMLTAVAVETGHDFKPGAVQPLFDTPVNHLWDDARNHYDVAPDGDRFLVAMPVENSASLPLTVVVNWNASGQSPQVVARPTAERRSASVATPQFTWIEYPSVRAPAVVRHNSADQRADGCSTQVSCGVRSPPGPSP